jgi:hypothetical protein
MSIEIDGVQETSPAPANSIPVVETAETKSDDKESNIAALRIKKEALEKENNELKTRLSQFDKSKDSLPLEGTGKVETPDPLKVIFNRDIKEASLQWNKKNKVTTEEWTAIREKVSLKGDETLTEIQEKIDEVYHALPTVRERREKELIAKGKRLAMNNISDDDMDMSGGGDVDMDKGNEAPLSTKEKNFLKTFGVTPDEQKKIDTSSNPNAWQEGKSPIRKFFEAGK